MAACVRTAWLVLGSTTLLLEDPTKGYFCSQLDLGFPAVREVVSDRPDQDGVDDRTSLMGSRVVTANISALVGAGARIDDVADNFAKYMAPSARPVLHYVLDRPGVAERTITLRGSGYSWPIAGAYQRDIQLQWVAADPYCYDPAQKTTTSAAGVSGAQGRIYPLVFNRVYPAGSGSSTQGVIVSNGDVNVKPLVRVYGPITSARIAFSTGTVQYTMAFQTGYVIDAGHWVDIDVAKRSLLRDSDPAQSVASKLNWFASAWPACPPLPGSTTMQLSGNNTTSSTQAVAMWNDAYLA